MLEEGKFFGWEPDPKAMTHNHETGATQIDGLFFFGGVFGSRHSQLSTRVISFRDVREVPVTDTCECVHEATADYAARGSYLTRKLSGPSCSMWLEQVGGWPTGFRLAGQEIIPRKWLTLFSLGLAALSKDTLVQCYAVPVR